MRIEPTMKADFEKRNFTIYAAEGALFSIALVFISYESVLPVLLARLDASPATISVIPVAIAIGTNLPGILFARRIEALPRKKPFVIAWGFGQRLPWLAVGVLTPLLALRYPQALVFILLLSLLTVMISSGIVMPAFYDLIGETVPSDRRGMLMAFRSGVSYFIGIGGGFLVRAVLRNMSYPWNFSLLYLIASVFLAANLTLFARIREPGARADRAPASSARVLDQLVEILRCNPGFRAYILARALLIIAHSTAAFFPLYLIRLFDLDDSASGAFVVIAAVTYLIVNPLLGRIGDRAGYRLVLTIDALVLVATGFIGVAGVSSWLAYGLICGAAVGRTVNLLSVNMAIDFAPRGRVPVFVGASGLVAGIVAPLGFVAGFLVEHLGYRALFWMTIAFATAALALLVFLVTEPRGSGLTLRPLRVLFARIK